MFSAQLFLSQVFNGLALGMLLALMSMGLTIVYGTLGVVNFAHGALFVVGGYAGYSVYTYGGSFIAAILAGAVATFVVGLVLERVVIRFFYDRPAEDQILVTFGLGIVLVEAIRALYGGISKTVTPPSWGQGITNLGFMLYPTYRIELLAISIAILALAWMLLYRTKIGLIVQAGIENMMMVNVLGINVRRVFLFVFGSGAAAAGLAGVLASPIMALTPDMGSHILVLSFVVVVLGGIGSFGGAVLGGIAAGEILSLTSMVNPAYTDAMLFAAMALVLIFRPQGLLGMEGRN